MFPVAVGDDVNTGALTVSLVSASSVSDLFNPNVLMTLESLHYTCMK